MFIRPFFAVENKLDRPILLELQEKNQEEDAVQIINLDS